jgi:hypothetical protein
MAKTKTTAEPLPVDARDELHEVSSLLSVVQAACDSEVLQRSHWPRASEGLSRVLGIVIEKLDKLEVRE